MTAVSSTRFNVIVQKDDSWYVAKCIDNSVASQGKSVEEALNNLKETLELYYEDEPLYDVPVPAKSPAQRQIVLSRADRATRKFRSATLAALDLRCCVPVP